MRYLVHAGCGRAGNLPPHRHRGGHPRPRLRGRGRVPDDMAQARRHRVTARVRWVEVASAGTARRRSPTGGVLRAGEDPGRPQRRLLAATLEGSEPWACSDCDCPASWKSAWRLGRPSWMSSGRTRARHQADPPSWLGSSRRPPVAPAAPAPVRGGGGGYRGQPRPTSSATSRRASTPPARSGRPILPRVGLQAVRLSQLRQEAAERARSILALPKSDSDLGGDGGRRAYRRRDAAPDARGTAVDPAHVAVAGHSAGGAYAYLLAYTTLRYSAVFTLAARYYAVSTVADRPGRRRSALV